MKPLVTTSPGIRSGAFGPSEWSLLGSIALIWGSSFLFIEVALRSVSPAAFATVRVLLGALTLLVFRAARSGVDRADLPRIALLGFIWIALPLTLIPYGQQWVSSSLAGMLNGSMPIFAAAIAVVLLRKPPGKMQAAGLALGFAGVVAISWPALQASDSTVWGALLILVATASYGLSVNIAVPLQQRYGSLPVLLRAQAFALVMTLPLGVPALVGSTWTAQATASMAFLGILGTGVAFVFMATLVGSVGATRGSIAIYFLPVVAIVLGVLILDERVEAIALLGTALVLVSGYLVSRREPASRD